MTYNIEDLNEGLRRAENALRALALGVEARVPLGIHELVFEKRGNDWVLVIVKYNGMGTEKLLDASRELRTLAAGKLDALLKQLLDEACRISVCTDTAVRHCFAFEAKAIATLNCFSAGGK